MAAFLQSQSEHFQGDYSLFKPSAFESEMHPLQGAEGKCIEAREFIIALPESFPSLYEPNKLLQLFTDRFKEKYGVECVSALHHNKRKTNYHIHLIFSERKKLPEPIEKIATRNMFYDEQGKHVRTKKEILDESGNVRKGCKIVKKGEIYERNIFTAKNKLFKQDEFVDEIKHFYTDLINTLVKNDKEKLHVFDENGLYLATKKIGKNNPKAEQIQTDNEYRMRWNREVDRAIVSGVAETEIQRIKKEYISDRIRESFDVFGNQPERFSTIFMNAVAVLTMLISKLLQRARELSAKLFDTEQMPPQTPTQEPIPKSAEQEMPNKPKIPPKPVMSAEATAYPKLFKVYKELKRQNEIIFEAEKECNAWELERDDLKGLARFTKKGELQSRIDRKNEEIEILKIELSYIAKRYGYRNVQEFYQIYHKSHSAYVDYKEKESEWNKTYGENNHKPDKESIQKQLKNPPKITAKYQHQKIQQRKDRRAR